MLTSAERFGDHETSQLTKSETSNYYYYYYCEELPSEGLVDGRRPIKNIANKLTCIFLTGIVAQEMASICSYICSIFQKGKLLFIY